VRLRRYDDEGKRVGAHCPSMAAYTPLLEGLRV
jgi:predicted HD phosphohydrolase